MDKQFIVLLIHTQVLSQVVFTVPLGPKRKNE
jgi:hypothetical protein